MSINLTIAEERKYAKKALDAMKAAGFIPVVVDGGEGRATVKDVVDALRVVFDYDEASVHFERDSERAWIFFVLGNGGNDVVCDCSESADKVLEEAGFYED